MATRRPLSRPQERYVPQQESYRNLPVAQPQASPANLPAQESAAGSGNKLKEMADAFAVGNKAIADFLRMEKSFEETNAAANEVRARLGLPPIAGKGVFDYGSDAGYFRGQGKADAIDAVTALRGQMEREGWGVKPGMTHEELSLVVQQKVQEGFTSILEKSNSNPAYLEGAAADLAKFKVEAVVTATSLLDATRQHKDYENTMKSADSFIDTIDYNKGADGIREEMGRWAMDTVKLHGIDRTTAAAALSNAFIERTAADYEAARESSDPDAMQNVMLKQRMFLKAMNRRDAAGFKFGGFTKQSDGSYRSNLREEFRELKKLLGEEMSEFSQVSQTVSKRNLAQLKLKVLDDMSSGKRPDDIVEAINSSAYVRTDPENAFKLVEFVFNATERGMAVPGSSAAMAEILSRETMPSDSQVMQMANDGILSYPDAVSIMKTIESRSNTAALMEMRKTSQAARDEYNQMKKQRADSINKFYKDNPDSVADSTVVERLFDLVTDYSDASQIDEVNRRYHDVLRVKKSRDAMSVKPQLSDKVAFQVLELDASVKSELTSMHAKASPEQQRAAADIVTQYRSNISINSSRRNNKLLADIEDAFLALEIAKALGAPEETTNKMKETLGDRHEAYNRDKQRIGQ